MARHKLLTEKEVSEWLGIPEATLKTQRARPPKDRTPLPSLKLPNGKIAYREDLVNQWIEDQTSSDSSRGKSRRTG